MGSKRGPKQEPSILSLDEANELYGDKWVLMKVTDFDDRHDPIAGHVVTSGSERAVWRKFERLHAQREGGSLASYYIFKAFPRVRSGEDWGEILREAADRGPPRGWRW